MIVVNVKMILDSSAPRKIKVTLRDGATLGELLSEITNALSVKLHEHFLHVLNGLIVDVRHDSKIILNDGVNIIIMPPLVGG